MTTSLTQVEARARFIAANNAGLGYAPYTDVAGEDSIESAVTAATADGWEIDLRCDDGIVVLRNGDGELMAIGDDGSGRTAWAADITAEAVSS
jgi:hypothetical protein